MTAAALVLKAGIATTLQDLGRPGYRACGVPHSGALDALSFRLANLLVGNAADTAALEMLYSGVVMEASGGTIRLAVAGAASTIQARDGAPRELPAWQSATLRPGERLRVGAIRDSAAAYLAIEGGFTVEPVLGSRSTYVRGALGGWHGRALRSGDVLPLARNEAPERAERAFENPPVFTMPGVLRVRIGPHDARFTSEAIETFLRAEYTVSSASDRSGLRLEGPALAHAQGYDLASEGLVPGSIQVPGSGLPVVLIADHPTVGGYPRIATIVSADVPAAGRLRIGARIRFAAIDESEAKRAWTELETHYANIARSIRDAPA